jgi:hypothetical protein
VAQAKTTIQAVGKLARPSASADLDPGNLRLNGKGVSARLANAITSMTKESRIDGSGTLTIVVYDYSHAFLRSQLLQGAVHCTFDGIDWTLAGLSVADNGAVTMTFEETSVSLLRMYTDPKKADRAVTTRAQFVRSMITEVTQATIPYRIPEVNVRQPIALPAQTQMANLRRAKIYPYRYHGLVPIRLV